MARSLLCSSARGSGSICARAIGWSSLPAPSARQSSDPRAALASKASVRTSVAKHVRRNMGVPMSIIEFIRDRARFYNCPVCGRSLKGCDIQVLSHEEERFHIQVTCAQCQVTFIVVIAIAGGAVPRPPIFVVGTGDLVLTGWVGPAPFEP